MSSPPSSAVAALARDGEPAISERFAFACSILYTLLYVAPFYLSATLRHTPLNSRNSPVCIRARVRAVALTCLACALVTTAVLRMTTALPLSSLLHLLGLYPLSIASVVQPLLLTLVLFACSLYEFLLTTRHPLRLFTPSSLQHALWHSPQDHRNLVAAPLSEELVFRALTIPLFLASHTPPARIVFLTPLVFGLAHLHHLVEFLQTYTPPGHTLPPRAVCIRGLARSLFQFAYTSLFGFFAAFVFLRTANLCAVVAVHSFCNAMGLPRMWGRLAVEESEDDGGGDVGASTSPQLPLVCTAIYYLLAPVGMYAFYALLWPLTESENRLVEF